MRGFDHEIVPGRVWSRLGFDELRKRYDGVDLVAVDLDECLFKGVSQSVLGRLIFFDLVKDYRLGSTFRYVLKFILGFLYLVVVELRKVMGRPIHTAALMRMYEKVMRGLPEEYFSRAAAKLPSRSAHGALMVLGELSQKAPVGITSIGIDVVLKEYISQAPAEPDRGLSFYDGNRIIFDERGGKSFFSGYDRRGIMRDAHDKEKALKRRITQYGAAAPLVVGHDENDAGMARLARAMGGIAIGLDPHRDCRDEFDVIIKSYNWYDLARLLRIMTVGKRDEDREVSMRIREKFGCAIKGIGEAIRIENSFKFHFAAALAAILISILLHVSSLERVLILLVIGLVLVAEMFNTVVELALKLMIRKYHPVAEKILDISAGAVLVCSLVATTAGVIIFGPKFWAILR